MPEETATEDSSEVVREQSESVAAANLKSLGAGPAWFQNQMYAEALAQSQAMNQIRLTVVAKAAESIMNMSPQAGADASVMMALLDKLTMTSAPTANVPPGGTG